jgi:anthranilate phosphoribosyltransferase
VKALIDKLRARRDLNSKDIGAAITSLLSAKTVAAQKAEFLQLLQGKGETPEEIAGFVEHLIDRAVDPGIQAADLPGPMIDVCGTGGAGQGLFNVSTTIMFILAAGGAVVVKHGNRRVTSCCGSADVLEALGIRIEWPPKELKECVQRLGLGFIFAPLYQPAFRALAEMRAQSTSAHTRTVFNLLGPLLNPARPAHQLVGVYTPRLTSAFAEVVRQLGRKRAWIVHGHAHDGLGFDDVSISGVTTLAELAEGRITSAVLDCRWLGIPEAKMDELRGADAAENARTLTGILSGTEQGPKRNLAIVNAAAGFVAASLARDMGEGIGLAREQIDNGGALEKLRNFQEASAA